MIWLLLVGQLSVVEAFVCPTTSRVHHDAVTALSATTKTTQDSSPATALVANIDTALADGQDPIPYIEQLEAAEVADAQPNRSPTFFGDWYVHWTNCPPPSNGQLGPFTGTSEQSIDNNGSYVNILRVPPNDWLMAVLDGVYTDWDGRILSDDSPASKEENKTSADASSSPTLQDWGARHWKVTFLKLTISVLGFPVIQKEFPPDTSRIWRTTYLQDNVRVVRAGKTGRTEDEVIFYTKRQPMSS